MARNLSSLEHRVMTILWRHGPCTVDAVRGALPAVHPLKDSTIRTVLRRLEDKGFVKHAAEGRANVYRAAVRPERALARALRQVVDRFCGGSVEALLVGMVADRMTSPEELQRLADKIAEADDEPAPRKGDPVSAAKRPRKEIP
jgi:BlaI family transcriptional regulator, penicillinase repressor